MQNILCNYVSYQHALCIFCYIRVCYIQIHAEIAEKFKLGLVMENMCHSDNIISLYPGVESNCWDKYPVNVRLKHDVGGYFFFTSNSQNYTDMLKGSSKAFTGPTMSDVTVRINGMLFN